MSEELEELDAIARNLRAHLTRIEAHGTLSVPAAAVMAAAVVPAVAAAPAPVRSTSLALVSLDEVRAEIGDCQRCKLSKGRKNIVFGVGNPDAELVFVGEAPGANEDIQGEPFVGDAGQLLTRMIEAMGWRRQDVYIANIIKCRPPGNRNPEPDEISSCEPFLKKQLGALRPRIIVALGKFAAQWLTGRPDIAISALRGKFFEYEGVRVMPTYHPAYLLRTPAQKRVVWEDLQLVMAELAKVGVMPPAATAARAG